MPAASAVGLRCAGHAPSHAAVIDLARRVLAPLPLGGGTPHFFVQLSRLDALGAVDFASFTTASLVHGADDDEVMLGLASLPDIESLALFVRGAALRGLTKAAEASHIGLAAASRRRALLEHRFKAALFERSPRGVELTAAGAALQPHARALLVGTSQLQADMRDPAAGSKGALRILANISVVTDALPDDLASFAQANPDLLRVVVERWRDEIVRSLIAAEGDSGIVVEGVATEELETQPYRSDLTQVCHLAQPTPIEST